MRLAANRNPKSLPNETLVMLNTCPEACFGYHLQILLEQCPPWKSLISHSWANVLFLHQLVETASHRGSATMCVMHRKWSRDADLKYYTYVKYDPVVFCQPLQMLLMGNDVEEGNMDTCNSVSYQQLIWK